MAEPRTDSRVVESVLSAVAASLVLIGIWARFHGLSINGFWYDELVSVVTGDPARPLQAIIFDTPPNEVHPPLYVLLLAAWRSQFGASETAIRSLSALVGTGTLGAAFWWGRNILPAPVRRLFIVLLACSLGGIVYSQEARPYALLVFLATMITLMTTRATQEIRLTGRLSTHTLLVLVGLGSAASYTHYFGLLLMGGVTSVLIYHALLQGHSLRRPLLTGLSTLLLLAPWLIYELPRKEALAGVSFWPKTTPGWILEQARVWTIYVWGYATVIVCLVVVLAVLGRSRGRGVRQVLLEPIVTPLMLAIFTVLLAGALSMHTSLFVARYFLVIAPAVYLAVAYAFGDSWPSIFGTSRWGTVVGLASGMLMLASLPGYYQPFKQEFREAARYIIGQPGCQDADILAWREPDWASDFLPEYQFYIPAESQIRLVSFEAGGVNASEAYGKQCPIIAWVAFLGNQPHHSAVTIRALGLDASEVDIVQFRGTYVIRSGSVD